MLRSTSRAALMAAAAAPLILAAAPAAAEERDDGTVDGVTVTGALTSPLTSTSTGTRLGLTPLETPASVQVIPGDVLRFRGDHSVQEAVSRAAGVSDSGSSGNGGLGLTARGFSGVNSVMRLYDGLQMFVAAGTMTFPFDTWTVDRLEILGGPSSVLYGTGAIGGAVNVIPRRADTMVHSNTIRLGIGNYGRYRAALDSTGPINDRLAYRVSASRNTLNGWTDRGDTSTSAVSASLRFQATPTLAITVSEDYGKQNPAATSSIPLINGVFDKSLRYKNYQILDGVNYYEDSWTQLKAEWTPSDAVSVRTNFFVMIADRRWNGAGSPSYVPATGRVQRAAATDLYHYLQQFGNSTTAVVKTPVFGRPNTLSVGFDVNRLRFRHTYWIASGTTTVDLQATNPGVYTPLPGAYSYINLFYANQHAVFAEDVIEVTDKLSLVGGVRFDRYKVERREWLTGVGSKASFGPTSWRVGAVYNLRPTFTVYGQYSTATDPSGSVGNMSAAAQKMEMMNGRQIEIGAKQAFGGGRGEWTVALYRIVKNNLSAAVPDQPGVTQQIGQQSSKGIEASLSYNLGHGVTIDVNGSLLDAKYDDFFETVSGRTVSRAGNTPTSIPEKLANAWVTWSFLPAWNVRAGVRYVGKRYSDNANTRILDDYTIVDAGLRWDMTEKVALDLRASNALDKFYVPQGGGSTTALTPAAPRTVELTMTARF